MMMHTSSSPARKALGPPPQFNLAELVDEPCGVSVCPRGPRTQYGRLRAHGLPLPREQVASGTLHLQRHLLATGRFLTITSNSVLQYNAEQWAVKGAADRLAGERRGRTQSCAKEPHAQYGGSAFINELKAVARAAYKPTRQARTR